MLYDYTCFVQGSKLFPHVVLPRIPCCWDGSSWGGRPIAATSGCAAQGRGGWEPRPPRRKGGPSLPEYLFSAIGSPSRQGGQARKASPPASPFLGCAWRRLPSASSPQTGGTGALWRAVGPICEDVTAWELVVQPVDRWRSGPLCDHQFGFLAFLSSLCPDLCPSHVQSASLPK